MFFSLYFGGEASSPSEFGNRIDPITGQRDGHIGMDLAVPTGTPVRAALGGTVRVSKYDSSYGYYVTIGHENGLLTLYAHNSRLLVQPGRVVQAGDVISLSGSTGRSTGPYLHFEVRLLFCDLVLCCASSMRSRSGSFTAMPT